MSGNNQGTELTVPETLHIEAAPPPEPSPEQTERPRSAREEAVARIVERRQEAYAKELDYGETMADDARALSGHDPLTVEGREEIADAAAEQEREQAVPAAPTQTAAPTQAAAAPAPAAPAERLVNVNGQQFRVTQDQYDRLASVGALALEAMNRQPQQPAPVQQPAPQPQQPPRALLTKDEAETLSTRIQYGSPAESAQALSEMAQLIAVRGQPAQQQINPQAVANFARDQALQQIRLEQNLDTIGREFPVIFQDDTLSQLAALKLHKIRQRDRMLGVNKSDLDAYREACYEVQRVLPPVPSSRPGANVDPAPQPQAASNVVSMEQRFERKRAAPRQPTAVSRVAPGEAAQPRALTPSEIVAQMKRGRGQAV